MKKISAALLTFTVGVVAFNLINTEQVSTSAAFAVKQKAVEVAAPKIEYISTEKIKNFKPFFDSFEENQSDKSIYQGYYGWFMADDFKGMKEVWTVFLSRDDENSKDEKLVWSAMILTQHADYSPNDDDNFQSVWIKTENNRLSFRTNKIRGIEYKFDGGFFKNGKEFSNGEKVLKGTLRKFVKGRETAKLTADFAYQEPQCFH